MESCLDKIGHYLTDTRTRERIRTDGEAFVRRYHTFDARIHNLLSGEEFVNPLSEAVRHLFVTQDYGPDLGGMARRHVELCRRFGDGDETVISVSTVASRNAAAFDEHERYRIYRQPFPFERANRFSNQLRWARWLTSPQSPKYDVLHCGNIRPVGYG